MKMIEVVNQLQSQGHHISYYVRKDGGILIKSLDGIHFKGASGNAYARKLAGTELSEARRLQTKFALKERKTKKRLALDDAVEKEFKRVKKIWNKAFKAKEGKAHSAGYFGKSRLDWYFKHYGKNEVLIRIKEAERYATGLAYSENVRHLADFIEMTARNKKNNQYLLNLAEDIRANSFFIRDEWILPAYQALYKINEGADIRDVVKKVRAILRITNKQ